MHNFIYTIVLLALISGDSLATDNPDPHAHHRSMMNQKAGYQVGHADYHIPDVTLVDQHGVKHNLPELLTNNKPVIVSYIFTTCTTICPVLTATLASAYNDLSETNPSPTIVSISIDPQEDTPAKLLEYAKKYGKRRDWYFLTGDPGSIEITQRSMNAYRGSKLNHAPLTYIKPPSSSHWVRIEGFTSAGALVNEYRNAITEQHAK